MDNLKTISFRVKADAVDTLDALAESLDRDRSYLLNEAVEHYLELHSYHVRLIEDGMRAANAGDFVEHHEVRKMIGKLGRKTGRTKSRTK